MMDQLPLFVAAYSILFVAASSPGPAVALLLGIATTQGRGAALIASAGIAAGSVLINIATFLGVGVLLEQAAWAFQLLRLIGAAYLLWLAYGAFRKAVSPPPVRVAQVAAKPAWRHFAAGFLLQVTNPKAIVFWLAIAAVGAAQGGGIGLIALFAAGAFLISLVCHGAWAVFLSARPFRAAYERGRRWIEGALGTLFTFFALRLALSRD